MKYLKDIKDWKECINQVVCGDCLEGMKLIPDKSVDLILTDPPYGIEYNASKFGLPGHREFEDLKNDTQVKTGEFTLKFIFDRSESKIIFGAENFYKQIPHKGRWLCWRKRPPSLFGTIGSDFELAWIDKETGYYKMYNVTHSGAINADASRPGDNRLKRLHPTQKPVELMRQILLDYSKEGDLICDPFMGSWTTARACKDLGRNFIGFEISEKYCQIGEERLRQEVLF